jgi:hypothetical protein
MIAAAARADGKDVRRKVANHKIKDLLKWGAKNYEQ